MSTEVTQGEWDDAQEAYALARRRLYDARSDLRRDNVAPQMRARDEAAARVQALCARAPRGSIGCITGHDCASARQEEADSQLAVLRKTYEEARNKARAYRPEWRRVNGEMVRLDADAALAESAWEDASDTDTRARRFGVPPAPPPIPPGERRKVQIEPEEVVRFEAAHQSVTPLVLPEAGPGLWVVERVEETPIQMMSGCQKLFHIHVISVEPGAST